MSDVNAQPEFSLVLPCYNEETCLAATAGDLLRAFAEKGVRAELVLVNNGSTDKTGAVIDQLAARDAAVRKVTVGVNQGYGHGILEGLRAARAPYVGFLCADGQVMAHDVAHLCEVMRREGPATLVKVRRRFRKDGLLRKVQSIIYNGLMSVIFGPMRSLDVNGNPKILSRAAYEKMHLVSKDWFLDPEVMIKARWLGLRVIELNVQGVHRQGGKSHVRWHTCIEFMKNIARYRLGGAAREWRRQVSAPSGERS